MESAEDANLVPPPHDEVEGAVEPLHELGAGELVVSTQMDLRYEEVPEDEVPEDEVPDAEVDLGRGP
ncbi:uncharacterized protein BKCO1_2000151 [Diplodia corticola]|uniref:Uncharacterized protein n=1 Tax=Diplodia corticola TaxID=236234 RepID=A0A1J9RGM5_9PEZI|nr:uncharacterized protein BKCO1_2000151 [Diplodia corticola]OJD39744.1 hypothetical protein BKCO1_2000151 [Diplodia corticola]